MLASPLTPPFISAHLLLLGSVRSKLKHSERSMGHAHVMALKRRPELAQNPSAHWQRRSNFSSSAAALRGEQLARVIKVLKGSAEQNLKNCVLGAHECVGVEQGGGSEQNKHPCLVLGALPVCLSYHWWHCWFRLRRQRRGLCWSRPCRTAIFAMSMTKKATCGTQLSASSLAPLPGEPPTITCV